MLDFLGRADIPVAAGADRPLVQPAGDHGDVHGETGLDGPDLPPPAREPVPAHAVDVIAEFATSSDRPVTLVATGPLTNVALLAALRPAAAAALERVVIMGGSIGLGNVTPAAEFNIWADPDAAQRAFTSGLDVTMVGLDVTQKALFTAEQNDRLRVRGRVGRLAAELVDHYLRSRPEAPGIPIHDAVAMAQVVEPGLLTLAHRNVAVDCGPVGRGRTLVDLRQVTAARAERARRHRRRSVVHRVHGGSDRVFGLTGTGLERPRAAACIGVRGVPLGVPLCDAPGTIRTCDTQIRSLLLYPLSYGRGRNGSSARGDRWDSNPRPPGPQPGATTS